MHKLIDEFEHETEIAKYYTREETKQQKIIFDQFEAFDGKNRLHLFIDAKEITTVLDLKREVIMTMLNSLEKIKDEEKRFFKFEGVLPASIGVRFHRSKPEEMAQRDPFIKTYLSLAKEHQGIFRCSTQKLAFALNTSPFDIPKILFALQSQDNPEITYEVDQESFVLRILYIPSGGQTLDLAKEMLDETQRIEKNMIQKLNCMYFVARRISMPTVEHMLKKEKQEDSIALYKGFSRQLNDLINMYFSVTNEEKIEEQIAGDAEERAIMMPLRYITTFRDKSEVESEIKVILKEYHEGQRGDVVEANERMKPLDLVKIMMGIYSERANIKRFMNNSKVWAKFQEYDYEELYKQATSVVNQFYID